MRLESVRAENERLKAQLAELRANPQVPLSEIADCLCDVAQLLDGWHCDTAWTEWDTTVREKVSRISTKIHTIRRIDGPAPMPADEVAKLKDDLKHEQECMDAWQEKLRHANRIIGQQKTQLAAADELAKACDIKLSGSQRAFETCLIRARDKYNALRNQAPSEQNEP